MFKMKSRVDEDLERIRRANLPADILAREDAEKEAEIRAAKEKAEGVSPKEFLAMTLAALSVVLPYIGAVALVLLGFWLMIKLMGG